MLVYRPLGVWVLTGARGEFRRWAWLYAGDLYNGWYPRKLGMVSRGGVFLAAWMLHNQRENPLYARYDYLLELAKEALRYPFMIETI